MPKVKIKCSICKKTIETYPSIAKTRKYCSIKCRLQGVSKILQGRTGYWKGKPSPFKGKKHTKETRKRISKALIGRFVGKKHPNWKPKIKKICPICKKIFYVIPGLKKQIYCSRLCQFKSQKGKSTWNKGTKGIMKPWNKGKKLPHLSMEKSSAWNGGKTRTKGGYIRIYIPEHPYASSGYVFEHRLIMEKHLGRYLTPEERVHHKGIKYSINSKENKGDNRLENLMYFCDESNHQKYESKDKDYSKFNIKGRIPWNKKEKIKKSCLICGKTIYTIESLKERKKFCSKKCSYIAKKGCIPWNKGKKGTYDLEHSGSFKKGFIL